MNKIVLEHYPVSQLPEDLRDKVGEADEVTLTIEAGEKAATRPENLGDWFAKYQHIHCKNFRDSEEVNEWVRSLRDEWSHRER
jgi:hypothetical protein